MFKQVADFLRISEDELQGYFDMPLVKGDEYKHGSNWLIKLGVKIMFLLGKEKRVTKIINYKEILCQFSKIKLY